MIFIRTMDVLHVFLLDVMLFYFTEQMGFCLSISIVSFLDVMFDFMKRNLIVV